LQQILPWESGEICDYVENAQLKFGID